MILKCTITASVLKHFLDEYPQFTNVCLLKHYFVREVEGYIPAQGEKEVYPM